MQRITTLEIVSLSIHRDHAASFRQTFQCMNLERKSVEERDNGLDLHWVVPLCPKIFSLSAHGCSDWLDHDLMGTTERTCSCWQLGHRVCGVRV